MAENFWDSLLNQSVLSDDAQEKLLSILPKGAKEKLSIIFQKYQELSDEEKKNFSKEMVQKFMESLHDKVSNSSNLYTQFFYSHSYIIFIFAVLLIVSILVFFVYKLFKVLSERKAKREEKKKNKQMKKKK
ncbi:uncharacterized protein LOC143432633 isoform X3 [Xylocopa sonorina]|uniref:uncharacterized protein LOC143432633 isoform X3 n=1 Tax=Xylocopa sonorina TaxID=1818115 RepID=UPI00403A7FCC